MNEENIENVLDKAREALYAVVNTLQIDGKRASGVCRMLGYNYTILFSPAGNAGEKWQLCIPLKESNHVVVNHPCTTKDEVVEQCIGYIKAVLVGRLYEFQEANR